MTQGRGLTGIMPMASITLLVGGTLILMSPTPALSPGLQTKDPKCLLDVSTACSVESFTLKKSELLTNSEDPLDSQSVGPEPLPQGAPTVPPWSRLVMCWLRIKVPLTHEPPQAVWPATWWLWWPLGLSCLQLRAMGRLLVCRSDGSPVFPSELTHLQAAENKH